ncbi:FAD-binding protein [Alloiococcus sp. CFN-8]|uniref:electron transfer flavoprotein subunit alpha/FixB family protein n=1 Tax=Alloiococcus sp. CFN-8 TaxID=3416081 RepID=UPI003CFB4D73
MGKLIFNQEKIGNQEEFIKICPFNALVIENEQVTVNSACKMCKLCVKKGPEGAAIIFEEEKISIDKSQWRGIMVYVDHVDGEIHPVTYELIGKAKELASKISHPVYAVFIGSNIEKQAEELLHYGVDKVFVYDQMELARFNIETYTNALEKFVNEVKPTAMIMGATSVGRQLAPRVAARLKTGLTADCTVLDIDENTDLAQIRPAFGGNIMAHILTPNHRPQMATVRYKVMEAAPRMEKASGDIVKCTLEEEKLSTNIEVIDIVLKEKEQFIEASEVLVVAGRGIKKQEDLAMLQELADALGGQMACTRPLAETGWMEAKRQVGLSGRTVRPKLIITCGVSGAIQFAAGMKNSENIIAINKDENAAIFKSAHYCIVGDLYEIIPQLIEKIKLSKGA